MNTFIMNMKVIQPPLRIWPPPHQIEWAGSKIKVVCDLNAIATLRNEPRPRTDVLSRAAQSSIPNGTVLKRSNSDCGQHVIMPGDRARRNWDYLTSLSQNQEVWMSQEYVRTLEEVGEWRTFIVCGQILHVVHSWKGSNGRWHGVEVTSHWSLNEVQ